MKHCPSPDRLSDPFANFIKIVLVSLLSLIMLSCAAAPVPKSELWQQQYQHLNYTIPENNHFTRADYYIVFLVAARHLDYSDSHILFEAVSNIDNKLRRSRVGHSWIYLRGIKDSQVLIMEGGQSVGFGKLETGFIEGVVNLANYGYADPTAAEKQQYRYEPNPIKYLWDERDDGFFQQGSGLLSPTFAAKVNLTKEQFEKVLIFMDPDNHSYKKFSLTGNQCSSFVAAVAELVGIELDHFVTINIPPEFDVNGNKYLLWTDPQYSKLTFSTPDILERSLIQLVVEGRAEYALDWYRFN
jgi:hypothetical protein